MRSKIDGEPSRTDNSHWIWTGSRYANRIPFMRYQGLTYLPAVCLAAYPRIVEGGHVLHCNHRLCVNPNHCVVSIPPYTDMDVLFIQGPKDFPHISPEEVARHLYNPDDDLWAHRVRKALRAPQEVVERLLASTAI